MQGAGAAFTHFEVGRTSLNAMRHRPHRSDVKRVLRVIKESVLMGEDDRRTSIPQVQLGQDPAQVRLDGCLSEEEFAGNLLVVQTTPDLAQHIPFSVG